MPAEPAGPHRDAAGGRQPHPPRERRAGQRRGGPDLPAALESAQRVRPAERPGAARRLPAAGESRAGPLRRVAGGGQPRPNGPGRYGRGTGGRRRALTATAPPGLFLRVRLLGHVLRQRRDLAVLPAPRHPQQHGAQPGRDVRPPGRPPPRDFRMPALPA